MGGVLEKYNLKDKSTSLVFSVDKTRFLGEPSPPQIVSEKHSKVNAISSPRDPTIIVLATSNDTGNLLPPYFVFKGKRRNTTFKEGELPGVSFFDVQLRTVQHECIL